MKIQIEVAPFPVPDSVSIVQPPRKRQEDFLTRQEGFKPNEVIPLNELSRDELDGLIAEFADAVYVKAGIPTGE